MATPRVDLTTVSLLTEIVVRAGNAQAPHARSTFQRAYLDVDIDFPDAVGISTLFRQGATLDELAREGSFPHAKLSYSIVGRIVQNLDTVGYQLVLYVTSTARLPDHHSLAVAVKGVVQPTLSDVAADALLAALSVIDNPYRPQLP